MRRRTLIGVARTSLALFLLVGLPAGSARGEYAQNMVVVRFASGVVTPPPGENQELQIQDYEYSPSSLESMLLEAGVVGMSKIFPDFTSSSLVTTSVDGDSITLPLDLSNYYILELADTTVTETVGLLAADTLNVLAAQPAWLYHKTFTPSDSLFAGQWWLKNAGQFGGAAGEDVGADEAWNIWTGADTTIDVAILDTGVDVTHPDLHIGFGFGRVNHTNVPWVDDEGHGSSVSGIVGAIGNNRIGVAGVNWGAQIIPVKVLDAAGNGQDADIAYALDWVRQHRHPVANMSLAGPGVSDAMRAACKNANAAGVLLVAAMGNENSTQRSFPAGLSNNVFAVGAMMKDGTLWDDNTLGCGTGEGSNRGDWIDVIAPGGRQIQTTRRQVEGSYYSSIDLTTCGGFGGTSAATPVVSGLASLLKAKHPQLSNDDLAEIIRRTAREKVLYGPRPSAAAGWGLVRADAALKFVGGGKAIQRAAVAGMAAGSPSNLFEMTIVDEPCRSTSGKFWAKKYMLTNHISFGTNFASPPDVWIRGNETNGWNQDNPHVGPDEAEGWAEVDQGSITTTGFDVHTFVYGVYAYLHPGEFLGWCPAAPWDASVAYTAVGKVHQDPDTTQSFYVPQSGSTGAPAEGALATRNFRMCPNNDGGASLPNSARIKVVVRDAAGNGVAGIAASDIYLLFNGGTPELPPTGQGFRGPGADSIIANSQYNSSPLCPDVRAIPADAPTDPAGATFITFTGASATPGVGARDATRKWGHYDSEIPVFVYWQRLKGRLTSTSPLGSYELQIKNFDFNLGLPLKAEMNLGEAVTAIDFNVLTAHLGQHDSDSTQNWWMDFNSDGEVNNLDYNILSLHVGHNCNSPNSP